MRCEESITPDVFLDCDDPTQLFTSLIHQAAEEAIPQTSTTPKRPHKPCFDEDCKNAIRTRISALRQFDQRPTQENHVKFKIARAKARKNEWQE